MGKTITESKYFEQKHLERFLFLIKEYKLIKNKQHPEFSKLNDFYSTHNIDRRVFLKYYHRYKDNPSSSSLVPQKRGPRYKTRSFLPLIENKVIELRLQGHSKYHISSMLRPKLKNSTPSPSGVYNILKRKGLNIMNKKTKETKRQIIKAKAGELAHVDCHYLTTLDLLHTNNKTKNFLVSVMDDCTRLTLCEIVHDLKSLTVMFSVLRQLNMFEELFKIKFKELLTDNGAEFGNKNMKDKDNHPFERMLKELEIKHRYTRPYRPQTNGKIERFWRTLNEDLVDNAQFENIEIFEHDLTEYICYYNYQRTHQGLNNKVPFDFSKTVETVV